MITASLHKFADPPWGHVGQLRVGRVPAGLGTPDAYVLIENDGAPFIRVDVHGGADCYAFEDVVVWLEFVVIGFGSRVHMLNYQTQGAITLELDAYFGHFYPGDDWMIVASGDRLFRIDPAGSLCGKLNGSLWTA